MIVQKKPVKFPLLILCFGIVVTSGAAISYIPQLPLFVAALLAVSAWLLQKRSAQTYCTMLTLGLFGYFALGRAFAYFGVAPLFVGELLCLTGLLTAVRGHVVLPPYRFLMPLGLFFVWNLARTVPYARVHGIDAVRDAALWYYALFAIIVCSVFSYDAVLTFFKRYRHIVVPITLLFLVTSVVGRSIASQLPAIPGTTISIIQLKQGDRAIVLVGFAVFILCVAPYLESSPRRKSVGIGFWIVWIGAFSFVAIGNRGGLIATVVALGVACTMTFSMRWLRLALVATVVASLLVIVNPRIDVGGAREVSVSQFTDNISSIFGGNSELAGLQGTKEWRLEWWKSIWNYTVNGPHFWAGKGYGINLADADGFQVSSDGSLRSPHSVHLNFLARSGVPGFVLWIWIHVSFISLIVPSYLSARRRFPLEASLLVWVLACWLAALVNASFDVYLEGPQGAIPFWCTVGFGLVLVGRINQMSSPLKGSYQCPPSEP